MTKSTSSSGGLPSISGISEDVSVSDQVPDTVEQPVVSLVPSELTRKHVPASSPLFSLCSLHVMTSRNKHFNYILEHNRQIRKSK